MNLASLTITELRRLLVAGEITPIQIIDDIEKAIILNDSEIKAYISYDFEKARRAALTTDLNLPLGGIPIGIKDNINTLGESCTCGSQFLADSYVAPYDATVIAKLKAAGAIPLGRMNMDEFAMGSTTGNSSIQPTSNPHDLERVPGGSSGGSAAAVAANTAIATLGSDTGGSIRQPASHCGIVGLKPSYGRVSRYGLVAFASSLDQIGPCAKTVEDAALILNIISGSDEMDSTSLEIEVPDFTASLNAGVKGLKLGIPKEYFTEGMNPAVREVILNAIDKLKAAGAEIIDISLPHTEYAVATYYIIAPAEASSNLSRFDGIRYGNRAEQSGNLIALYKDSRSAGFGSEVKRRIILGTYALSSGYDHKYYNKAQKVRTLIRQDFTSAFECVDAILTPVCPHTAPAHGENSGDPLKEYLEDICTIAANLAGIPGISIPVGQDKSEMPVGLQILGPHLGEEIILQVAQKLENIT